MTAPRSSRRFGILLATAAGSGPGTTPGVHAQSVQYNAQLGGNKWAGFNSWDASKSSGIVSSFINHVWYRKEYEKEMNNPFIG